MIGEPSISHDDRIVTVRVPISIRRRGGRKLVLAPDGSTMALIRQRSYASEIEVSDARRSRAA